MNKNFDSRENALAVVPGVVKIHENVIATIVRRIACSVEGVSKISGSSFVDNIAEMVGSKKMHDRSILVDMGDASVSVEVSINLLYGYPLPQVAAAVQEALAKGEYTFKQDYYFMMGDNRHNSLDSRYWGFVPEDHIVGKPVVIWLSTDRNQKFPKNIRWDRFLKFL